MSTPKDMPQKRVDPNRKSGRNFNLGERNPDSLPGSGKNAESFDDNQRGSRSVRRLARWAFSIHSVGAKY